MWSKNVEVDWYFIKQNLNEKIIRFPFHEDQLVDILAKVVSNKKFLQLTRQVRNVYVLTWTGVLAWVVDGQPQLIIKSHPSSVNYN